MLLHTYPYVIMPHMLLAYICYIYMSCLIYYIHIYLILLLATLSVVHAFRWCRHCPDLHYWYAVCSAMLFIRWIIAMPLTPLLRYRCCWQAGPLAIDDGYCHYWCLLPLACPPCHAADIIAIIRYYMMLLAPCHILFAADITLTLSLAIASYVRHFRHILLPCLMTLLLPLAVAAFIAIPERPSGNVQPGGKIQNIATSDADSQNNRPFFSCHTLKAAARCHCLPQLPYAAEPLSHFCSFRRFATATCPIFSPLSPLAYVVPLSLRCWDMAITSHTTYAADISRHWCRHYVWLPPLLLAAAVTYCCWRLADGFSLLRRCCWYTFSHCLPLHYFSLPMMLLPLVSLLRDGCWPFHDIIITPCHYWWYVCW